MNANHPLNITYKLAKRIVITLVGGTVLLIGIVMLVLPGPGLIVIPIGLGILGIEFAWARRWLKQVKARTQQMTEAIANQVRGTNKSDSKIRSPRE
jgi:tellurite resistance protein TerC